MRSLFTKPQAPVTSDAVIFNYQQPARARLVALGSGKKLWLVETYDPQHKVWVWQQEPAIWNKLSTTPVASACFRRARCRKVTGILLV